MKNQKFLTKYNYILKMHKVIKYNNKLQILGWHLLLFITNTYQTNMECLAISTFAEIQIRKFLLWEMYTRKYVIPSECLLQRIAANDNNFRSLHNCYSQMKRIIRMRNIVTSTMVQQMDIIWAFRVDTAVFKCLNNSSVI